MILQRVYKPVLNFIYEKITAKVNDGIRNAVMVICFFAVFAAQFLDMYGYHVGMDISSNMRDLIVGGATALIILASVNGPLEICRWELPVYIPFVLTGVLIIVAGLDHYVGESYTVTALFMLFECICLFFVWGNRKDYEHLFDAMAMGFMIFAVILFAFAFATDPYMPFEDDYTILGINTNGFAKVLAPAVVSSCYLMIRNADNRLGILYGFLTGVSVFFLYATAVRAGYVIMILVAMACIICYIKAARRKVNKPEAKRILVMVIIVVVGIAFSLIALKVVMPNVNPQEKPAVSQEEEKPATIDGVDRAYVRGTTEFILRLGTEAIHGNETLQKLDDYSCGRVKFFAAYVTDMNLKGHDYCIVKAGAHNTYVEYSYRAGVFTGIFWFLCVLICAIYLIKDWVFGKQRFLFFVALAWAMYFTISMLDTGYIPVERGFGYMFYVAIAPLMIKMTVNDSLEREDSE